MNDLFVFVILPFIAVLALVAVGVAWWAVLRVRRMERLLRIQETTLLSLKGALSVVCSEEMAADQRRAEVERRLSHLAEQQALLLMRDPEQGPYQQAMRMAVQGASREDLMRNCGLTRGEADLLLALHGSSERET